MKTTKRNGAKKITLLLLIIITFISSIFLGIRVTKAHASSVSGVIQLSIYSRYSGNDLGHAWLVIENGTDEPYNFYNAVIFPGETFSIGTWGNRKDPDTNETYHGAWLNLEAYYQSYDNTASLTITITPSQLATVSKKCISMNRWDALKNCSYFASEIWNTVAPRNMKVSAHVFAVPGSFPHLLKSSIMSVSGYQTNRGFEYNDYTGYCINDTTFKYIKASRIPISDSSSGSVSPVLNDYYTSFPEEYNTFEKIQNAYEQKNMITNAN